MARTQVKFEHSHQTGGAPTNLTLAVIEREATQILADFRSYSEAGLEQDLRGVKAAIGVVAQAEILRIGQRLSRSFLWIFLKHEGAIKGKTNADRAELSNLIAGCGALQVTCGVHLDALPIGLQRLSSRSHALFDRVRRLQAAYASRVPD